MLRGASFWLAQMSAIDPRDGRTHDVFCDRATQEATHMCCWCWGTRTSINLTAVPETEITGSECVVGLSMSGTVVEIRILCAF